MTKRLLMGAEEVGAGESHPEDGVVFGAEVALGG